MIKLMYEQSLVNKVAVHEHLKQLKSEIEEIKKADHKYSTPYGSIHLPFDKNMLEKIKNCIQQKKTLQPSLCIVIGIGGSNLGTIAVHQALSGLLYNVLHPSIAIYFADTVDSDYIAQLYIIAEQELKQGKNIILNVVSKSGTTTETIANFEVFLKLLKQHRPYKYQDCIVVTTDKDSKLWSRAQQEKFASLAVPDKVGGRYSVFSAVGLFPLGLLGTDLDQLLEGARAITVECIKDTEDNQAALSASIAGEWYKEGRDIFDLFLFSVELEGLGKWYRQLVGESLGKQQDRNGKEVRISIIPTVSIGSTDLHSMVQRYLGGKNNIGTTFVTVKKGGKKVVAGDLELSFIMNAIIEGTQKAYIKQELPFIHLELPRKTEYYLGQFLQYKMIEVIYLACLLGVDPFDQPAVELYKQETRELLVP